MDINFPKGKIGVAVSGGVDSMVLLYLLAQKQADILVINIEHGIRGEQSIQDSQFVAKYCKKMDINYLAFAVDTINESKQKKVSIELAGRNLRYQIFNDLLKKGEVDYIALGHHADDNVETILMRILRGTGIKGIKGIYDHSKVIHPLLNYSRQQIEEFAFQHRIPCIIDSSNLEDIYTRNFIRNNVLTTLRERFDNIHESFGRLAKNAQEVDDFLTLNTLNVTQIDNECSLSLSEFISAHPIVKKYTVIKIFNMLGVFQDLESRHYEYITMLLGMENNAKVDLPSGVTAIKEYEKLIFIKDNDEQVSTFYQGFSLDREYVFCGVKYSFDKCNQIKQGISFDCHKIPSTAKIRTRKEGDIFKKFGGGTKKLNDYLTDIKMPKRERDKLLLVVNNETVLMICGVEISEDIKVDKDTKEIFYIKKEIL